MNPAVIYGGAQIGKAIFGGLSSAAEKRRRRKRLLKLRGEDVIDVNAITAAGDRAIIEQSAKSGRRIDKTLGLDVGQAQGGIAESLAGKRMELRAGSIRENEILTARRNAEIDRQLHDLDSSDTLSTIGNVIGIAGDVGSTILAKNQAGDLEQEKLDRLNALAPKPVTMGRGDYQPTSAISDASGMPIMGGQNVYGRHAGIESQAGGELQPAPKDFEGILMQEFNKGEISLEEYSNLLRGKPRGGEVEKDVTGAEKEKLRGKLMDMWLKMPDEQNMEKPPHPHKKQYRNFEEFFKQMMFQVYGYEGASVGPGQLLGGQGQSLEQSNPYSKMSDEEILRRLQEAGY